MPSRRAVLNPCSPAVCAFLLVAALASEVSGQSAAPTATRVFTVDSAEVSFVASSSDGRWIAYTEHRTTNESGLFVRPAKGGAATRLTPPGPAMALLPRFSPLGDRIVYRSMTASNGTDLHIMAVPFDSRTGQATGAPRQVTLDVVSKGPAAMAISPDGKWIAYVPCCDAKRVRIVPITGGNARTIVDDTNPRGGLGNLAWTDDGSAVLYVTSTLDGKARRIMRTPVAGGRPVEVRRSTDAIGIGMLAPGGHNSAVVVQYGKNRRERELRIRGEDGSVVQRVRLPDNFYFDGSSWSPNGRAFVGLVSDVPAVIRVASTNGGPARTLTSGADYDVPAAWSADSRTVYYGSDGVPTLGAVAIDGVKGARLTPPEGGDYTTWGAVVGRYVISTVGQLGSTRQRVLARNLDDGKTVELTAASYAPPARTPIRGGGGTYSVDGNAYLYFEHVGKSMELRRVVPGERARIVRTFEDSLAGRMSVAVQNGRVIYSQRARDSIRFTFAATGTAAKVIASIPSGEGAGEIAWTSDGRHVAFAGPGSSLYTMQLAADGMPMGTLQRYQLPFEYMYELSFLNDGRRLTMIAQARGGPNAVVALVSLDDPSRPVILSDADGTSAWDHLMSPDGQWTAYSAELPPKGSTIYRVDLSAETRTASVPKR